MSYSEATTLLNALKISNIEGNFEIALDVINKYGSYKKALQATIKIEFKKEEALLIALLGDEEEENKDEFKSEANRLINLVRVINSKVFEDSQKYSMQFSDLIKVIKLDAMIDAEDLIALELVKPYNDAKSLISEINTYQNSSIQLEAFISALKTNSTKYSTNAIENKKVRDLIGMKKW